MLDEYGVFCIIRSKIRYESMGLFGLFGYELSCGQGGGLQGLQQENVIFGP